MKWIVLLIIILSLYLIYRLSFPRQAGKQQDRVTPPQHPHDDYEIVPKSRFVLPSQSNSAQHEDRKQDSDRQEEKADIFAAGNANPDSGVIPPDELDEAFGEDVNPEDLDIEEDENESDEDDEELRRTMNGSVAYADGYTIDEIAEAVTTADKPESDQSPEAIETLYHLSKTDMFEQLVSGDAGRTARIAAILDRREQEQRAENDDTDNNDSAYSDFDIGNFINKKRNEKD